MGIDLIPPEKENMITAIAQHSQGKSLVEIVGRNNYLGVPRWEVATLDKSQPFSDWTHGGGWGVTASGKVFRSQLSDIRVNGMPAQEYMKRVW